MTTNESKRVRRGTTPYITQYKNESYVRRTKFALRIIVYVAL